MRCLAITLALEIWNWKPLGIPSGSTALGADLLQLGYAEQLTALSQQVSLFDSEIPVSVKSMWVGLFQFFPCCLTKTMQDFFWLLLMYDQVYK